MLTENFIKSIKKYQVLYKESKHEERLFAWGQVAAETGLPVHQCQDMWRDLELKLHEEFNKALNGNGHSDWTFYEQMLFIKRFDCRTLISTACVPKPIEWDLDDLNTYNEAKANLSLPVSQAQKNVVLGSQ